MDSKDLDENMDLSGGLSNTTDTLTYNTSNEEYIDLSGISTISIGPSAYNGSTLTFDNSYYGYNNFNNSSVNITKSGIEMQEGSDIKIGDRSLSEFLDKMEERLSILRPNPELEDRWEELKNLRKQYQELEKELLEKEKMWKILKEI